MVAACCRSRRRCWAVVKVTDRSQRSTRAVASNPVLVDETIFFVEHVDLIISYVLIIIDRSFNDSNCGGIIEKGWLMICPGIVLPNILGTIIIHYGNSLLTSHCEGTTDGFEHC